MKRKLISAVRKSFRIALAQSFPDFSPALEPVGPHCDLFVWQPRPGLRWYLLLEPDLFEDCFHIEVASTPYDSLPPCHSPTVPAHPTAEEDLRFRITALWAPRDPYAAWWLGHPLGDATSPAILPSEDEGHVIRAVPHQVADCIERIRDYVLPYLSLTLAKHADRNNASSSLINARPASTPVRRDGGSSDLFSSISNVLPFSAIKSKVQTCLQMRERDWKQDD